MASGDSKKDFLKADDTLCGQPWLVADGKEHPVQVRPSGPGPSEWRRRSPPPHRRYRAEEIRIVHQQPEFADRGEHTTARSNSAGARAAMARW